MLKEGCGLAQTVRKSGPQCVCIQRCCHGIIWLFIYHKTCSQRVARAFKVNIDFTVQLYSVITLMSSWRIKESRIKKLFYLLLIYRFIYYHSFVLILVCPWQISANWGLSRLLFPPFLFFFQRFYEWEALICIAPAGSYLCKEIIVE